MFHTILFDFTNTLITFPGKAAIAQALAVAQRPLYQQLATRYQLSTDTVATAIDTAVTQQIRAARRQGTLYQMKMETLIDTSLQYYSWAASAAWIEALAYQKHAALCHLAQPAPDACQVLSQLHQEGYQLGLVTNAFFPLSIFQAVLEALGFSPYLMCCILSSEVQCAKPHLPIFQQALTRLRAKATTTIMVGDECLNDIAPAQKLGCWTVQTLQFKQDTHEGIRPHATIQALTQLPAVVAQMNISKLATKGT